MPLNITKEIECPSGLKGRIRGMKVRDEEILVDPRLAKTGDTLSHLLAACWDDTLDPGPYTVTGKLNWDKVSSADRAHVLIQLRIATYGDDYEFNVKCGKCPANIPWGLSLNDLEVVPTSEEGRNNLATGKPVPLTLSTGDVIKVKVTNGLDERFIANIPAKNKKRTLTFSLARRIAEIDGKTTWRDVLAEVEELPKRYADELWNLTDAVEGGVDTTFLVECPECGYETEVILPFDQGFFSTRRRSADSKEKSSG